MKFDRIGIARTDSIGDVVLTLPMAGVLKEHFPKAELVFIGRSYTVPIIQCSEHIDEVANWDDVKSDSPRTQTEWLKRMQLDAIVFALPEKALMAASANAGIPWRVATGRRAHSWKYANKRVWFSRRKSDLHEGELNLKLLKPFGIGTVSSAQLHQYYGFSKLPELPQKWNKTDKIRVVIHPKSQGSAVEWGDANFASLIHLLNSKNIEIAITGTEKEFELVAESLPFYQTNVVNTMGKMSLPELVAFINSADVLVAASTGPLHIAAACEVHAIGLYTPQRPMHPGRWKPLGTNANYLEASSHPSEGQFLAIKANEVVELIERFFPGKLVD